MVRNILFAPLLWLAANTCFGDESKILPVGAAPQAAFGSAIAIKGDFTAIGAPGDSVTTAYSGAVYVYHTDGRQWKLSVPDPTVTGLGTAVALDGNLLVVGFTGGNGGAYVFRFDGQKWVQEFGIRAGSTSKGFGYPATGYFGWGRRISVSGNCFVTATNVHVYDDRLENSGIASMYCYDGKTWAFRASFGPGYVGGSDSFGSSVALQDNMLVVGGAGNIYWYLFDGAAWKEQPRVPQGANVMALDGNRLLVSRSGVFVLERTSTGWVKTAQLTATGFKTGSSFGGSVALSGTAAVVGSPTSQTLGEIDGGGAAFVFRLSSTGWTIETPLYQTEAKLASTRDKVASGFATAVGVLHDRVVAGLPNDPTLGVRTGSAYVFTKPWPVYPPNKDDNDGGQGGPPPHAGGPPPGGGKPK